MSENIVQTHPRGFHLDCIENIEITETEAIPISAPSTHCLQFESEESESDEIVFGSPSRPSGLSTSPLPLGILKRKTTGNLIAPLELPKYSAKSPSGKGGEADHLVTDILTALRVAIHIHWSIPEEEQPLPHGPQAEEYITSQEHTVSRPGMKKSEILKVYAPDVFLRIRNLCGIENHDFQDAWITQDVILEKKTFGSSKIQVLSGNKKFLLKVIKRSRARFLRKLLPFYMKHIFSYPDSLIVKIYGLYSLQRSNGTKIYFIVMRNIFDTTRPLDHVYTLRGSLSKSNNNKKPAVAIDGHTQIKEDRDFADDIYLSVPTKSVLREQLQADLQFLSENNMKKYQLLLGIHDIVVDDTTTTTTTTNATTNTHNTTNFNDNNGSFTPIKRQITPSNSKERLIRKLLRDNNQSRVSFMENSSPIAIDRKISRQRSNSLRYQSDAFPLRRRASFANCSSPFNENQSDQSDIGANFQFGFDKELKSFDGKHIYYLGIISLKNTKTLGPTAKTAKLYAERFLTMITKLFGTTLKEAQSEPKKCTKKSPVLKKKS